MALDGNRLGTAMYTAMNALVPTPGGTGISDAKREDMWKAIGVAIVSEFTTNGVVNVANVTAVQPGGGVSGPGSGTIA